ncbi:heterokaryon incompatibility protein-domain-containing protein [Ustulina deusta]|nr:heterokaryon incompatibility protein-domain-containing protein [Ustulina deusta]
MIPPERFHSCHNCQKFAIDFEHQPSFDQSSSGEDIPSGIFFFDATLEDVLHGLADRCELCLWLDSLWKESSSSSPERYDILKASGNASSIAVCAETYSMSLVDRYPVDEIVFFGLWEKDAAVHPQWGRCRVFSQCSVDVFTTQGDAADRLIHNRPINRFPGSAHNLTLARQWLQECQTSHAKCQNVSQTFMPLRVLRICNGCGSCDFHVALETAVTNRPIEPFAALSYCWGGDQPYKTTKARMQSGDMSLSWHKLPKSLQDAVKTTAALGLVCLWADSLCIIQDDEGDKALQIANMARIYSQATVTIIASRASRAVDGFVGEINLTSQTQLATRLPFRCSGANLTVGSAYLTVIKGSRDSSEPIDSRAWTLQERYLSNRVLEFGSRQTRWTCASSPASAIAATRSYTDGWKWDKNPEDHTSQIMYLHGDLVADLKELATQNSSTAWAREWLHSRWQTVLSEYTPRLLSVPTDRILGISGVAETFLAHFRKEGRDENEEYLAGIWKSSLPSLLYWHADATEVTKSSKPQQGKVGIRSELPPGPEVYQGPSWSWVGVNCHVLFIFGRACDRDCRAVLLDADIGLADASAKCGSVTHAILTLKGRMRRSFWDVGDGTITTRRVRFATVYPDTCDSADRLTREHGLHVPVWLLEIGLCVGLKKRGPVGLVLEPVNASRNQDPPRFRRLGLFHIDTRKVQQAPQMPHHLIESSGLEQDMDFFEGRRVQTIQLE